MYFVSFNDVSEKAETPIYKGFVSLVTLFKLY